MYVWNFLEHFFFTVIYFWKYICIFKNYLKNYRMMMMGLLSIMLKYGILIRLQYMCACIRLLYVYYCLFSFIFSIFQFYVRCLVSVGRSTVGPFIESWQHWGKINIYYLCCCSWRSSIFSCWARLGRCAIISWRYLEGKVE